MWKRKEYSKSFEEFWRRKFEAEAQASKGELTSFDAAVKHFLRLHEEMIHWWKNSMELSRKK